MNRVSALTPKLALGAAVALAAISFSPGSARAIVVTVGGINYDVTTFTGTYNDNTSKFGLPPAPGVMMPWWGSASLANEFVNAVGSSLGFPNLDSTRGPYFATAFDSGIPAINYYADDNILIDPVFGQVDPAFSRVWAQATSLGPVTAPVPGPLPALGAATAFGFSRQLRERIKRSTKAISSSFSL